MKLKSIYVSAVLLFCTLFAGNAFAAFSFNLSTDYAAGDSQVVFNLDLVTDDTLGIYSYGLEFKFDSSELSFVSRTSTPPAGLRDDLYPGWQFNVDPSSGEVNGVSGAAGFAVEVAAGTYRLGTFTFDVIAGVEDGETDFNFNYDSAMAGFDFFSDYFGQTEELAPSFSADMAPAAVPVPAAVWLLGSGIAGLACFRRKQA